LAPGSDTILINAKDCINGFFVPTAFTPNGDGKNDAFRPLLFGRLVKYSFTIYNRWGQIIFKSSDIIKGWNGTYASTLQDNNVFAWSCTYQIEGQKLKTEKGTVVLIR
jgi:gliding motility-associated-like protein